MKATNVVCSISRFRTGCTKEVDTWTFTPTSSTSVSGELNCGALLLDSCGSGTGAHTLTGKWVWVRRFFLFFHFFDTGYMEAGFLGLWHRSQKEEEGLWMPILPKGRCFVHSCSSSSIALLSHKVLLLPAHPTMHNYGVCSQVSPNARLLSGSACSAVSKMQSITARVWLRFDFHLHSFVGSHVAK